MSDKKVTTEDSLKSLVDSLAGPTTTGNCKFIMKGTIKKVTKTIIYNHSKIATRDDILNCLKDMHPKGYDVMDYGLRYVTIEAEE